MSKIRAFKAGVAAVAVCIGLSACVTDGMGTKQMVGTGVGGAGGGAVGWFAGKALGGTTGGVIGAIVGTLGGAFVGSEIGSSLDKADQAALQSTANQALNQQAVGQPVVWQNPQTGNVVETTVVRDVYEPQPQQPRSKRKAKAAVPEEPAKYCREYQQKVTVGGKVQQAYGTACRQPDGSWQVSEATQGGPQG